MHARGRTRETGHTVGTTISGGTNAYLPTAGQLQQKIAVAEEKLANVDERIGKSTDSDYNAFWRRSSYVVPAATVGGAILGAAIGHFTGNIAKGIAIGGAAGLVLGGVGTLGTLPAFDHHGNLRDEHDRISKDIQNLGDQLQAIPSQTGITKYVDDFFAAYDHNNDGLVNRDWNQAPGVSERARSAKGGPAPAGEAYDVFYWSGLNVGISDLAAGDDYELSRAELTGELWQHAARKSGAEHKSWQVPTMHSHERRWDSSVADRYI